MSGKSRLASVSGIICAGVLALCCVSLCSCSENSNGQTAPAGKAKWQYLSLKYYDVNQPTDKRVEWTFYTNETGFKKYGDIADLYKALGGKKDEANASMVLDILGDQGWELISNCFDTNYAWTEKWVFKRRVQ